MKKRFIILFYILIFAFVSFYRNDIAVFLIENVVYNKTTTDLEHNDYSKQASYSYIKNTTDFKVKNKLDIMNVIYTIIDSGMNEFTFYCSPEYEMCQYDVEHISVDETSLSILNNFVHPYNSYNKLYVSTNNMGKIRLEVNKLYTNEEINYINNQLTLIKEKIIRSEMSVRDKIKAFHDYIIDKTSYDKERAAEIENNILVENKNNSHKANGVLKNNIALCSGYTDLMSIFLNDLNIKNYKISTDEHIWNAIYLDNKWYHLDMTWDDPVTVSGQGIILYDYFLISNEQLNDKKTNQHKFDLHIYNEIAITK